MFSFFGLVSGFAEDCCSETTPSPDVTVRQPQLSSVFPMGAQPGQHLEMEVQGEFLDRAAQVAFETPDVTGRVVSASFTRARLEVTVASNAVPGPRRLRLVSPRGASNTVMIRVSRWTTPVELEPNNDLDSPMQIQAPSLISGRLETEEDVDLYRFHAESGQRIQFNVLAARNLTPADVSLAILNPDGTELIHDDGRFIWDPYLDHTFDKEGDYLAAVTLTRMPAGGQSRNDLNYQLAVGQTPFFWSSFPLGARPGDSIDLALRADFVGPHMPLIFQQSGRVPVPGGLSEISGKITGRDASGDFRATVKIDPKVEPGVYEFAVNEDSGTLTPLKLIVGDLPEVPETETNQDQAGAQLLRYPVTVNGRIVSQEDEDWFRISVATATTFVLRVDAEKYGSIFDSVLTLFDAKGKKLASNDDAKWINRGLNRDSQVVFKFEEAGDYWVKLSSAYRFGGSDHVYRLTVRPQQPDFLLLLGSDRPTVSRAGKGKLNVTLVRLDGFKEDVSIQISGLAKGIAAKPLTIAGDKDSDAIELEATVASEFGVSKVEVFGTANIDGKQVRRKALVPADRIQGSGPGFANGSPLQTLLTVVEPQQFSLESAASTVYLVRGGTAEFGIKVKRNPAFTAALALTAENLPPGVSIAQVDLIDEGRMARLTLKATSETSRMNVHNLAIIGMSEQGGLKSSAAAPRIRLQLD